MATLGKVDEFDASKENWPQYEERLTHFLKQMTLTTLKRNARFSCITNGMYSVYD